MAATMQDDPSLLIDGLVPSSNTASKPLNPEPSQGPAREQKGLPPKSYTSAAKEGLEQEPKKANGQTPQPNGKPPHPDTTKMNEQESIAGRSSGVKTSIANLSADSVLEEEYSSDENTLTSTRAPASYQAALLQDKLEEPSSTAPKSDTTNAELVSGRQAGQRWHQSAIRWAPLNVPLQRRLQTFAVLCHAFTIPALLASFFMLATIPLLWPILVPYLLYSLFSEASVSGELSHRSERLRRSSFWSLFASYFPVRLHRSAELLPTRKYVFGVSSDPQPNEAQPLTDNETLTVPPTRHNQPGRLLRFRYRVTWFLAALPRHNQHTTHPRLQLPHPCLSRLRPRHGSRIRQPRVLRESPVQRRAQRRRYGQGHHHRGWWREGESGRPAAYDETRPETAEGLRKAGCEEWSRSCAGPWVRGMLLSCEISPNPYCSLFVFVPSLVCLFVCSMLTGSATQENELFEQFHPEAHPWIHKLQLTAKKILGFTIPLFHARGVFNYDVGLLPYRRPVNVVVGRAIPIEQKTKPDEAYINRIHAMYMEELRRLWEENKDRFAKQREGDLEIVE